MAKWGLNSDILSYWMAQRNQNSTSYILNYELMCWKLDTAEQEWYLSRFSEGKKVVLDEYTCVSTHEIMYK